MFSLDPTATPVVRRAANATPEETVWVEVRATREEMQPSSLIEVRHG